MTRLRAGHFKMLLMASRAVARSVVANRNLRGTDGAEAVIRSSRAIMALQPLYHPRGICWTRSVTSTVAELRW